MDTDFRTMTVGVFGMGLMGGSYAKRLTEIGCRVIGFNRSPEPLAAALADGAIAAAGLEHLGEVDIMIFCTAEPVTENFIREHLAELKKNVIMTDIAGVKRGGAARIEALLPPEMDFISAHPMAGREGAGYAQSAAGIFDGANYILVPSKRNRRKNVRLVERLAKALGSKYVAIVTPEEHDRVIAYVSHLPHAVASAVVLSDSFSEDMRHFIAGGFRDTTRIADINSRLWTELFFANRENLLVELSNFQRKLAEFREALVERDEATMHELLDEAGRRRRILNGQDPR